MNINYALTKEFTSSADLQREVERETPDNDLAYRHAVGLGRLQVHYDIALEVIEKLRAEIRFLNEIAA